MDTLATRLKKQGWDRCDRRELYRFRQFLITYPKIVETVSPQLIHRLSFSHLTELIDLPNETQRRFYEIECICGNWSVRELRRQIASFYYQRCGLSKDKTKLSAMAHAAADTFRHEYLGQLNTCVAYYKKLQMTPGDQPPIGILLCTR